MNALTPEDRRRMAGVVETRTGSGPTDVVAGWQKMLSDMLARMSPYFMGGAMITFQRLFPEEMRFFEQTNAEIKIPATVAAIFLPPSVRHQMLGGGVDKFDSAASPDRGVLVATALNNHDVIVNVLFALPPFTPAVDVYDRGQMVAGYQYEDIAACRTELEQILRRHLVNKNA
jgi:hypothetical protein